MTRVPETGEQDAETGCLTGDDLDLHVPDEPGQKSAWRQAILAGADIGDVLGDEGGLVDWLWSRWRTLATRGVDEAWLRAVVLGAQREIWLWLVGDRTWSQCCSGLVGRIARRIPRPTR